MLKLNKDKMNMAIHKLGKIILGYKNKHNAIINIRSTVGQLPLLIEALIISVFFMMTLDNRFMKYNMSYTI